MTTFQRFAAAWAVLSLAATPGFPADPPLTRLHDGVVLAVGDDRLKVQVCRERIVRVLYAPDPGFFARETLMIEGSPCRETPWRLTAGDGEVTLATAALAARVRLDDGAVTFLDRDGQVLLAERRGGKTLEPALVQGETTFHVGAQFQATDGEPAHGEAFYGLGQHQNGLMDYRGHSVDLYQHNIVAAVPFLVSSRGWGLLWDNTSHTRFGDRREPTLIPSSRLYDAAGRPGGLTGTYRQGTCAAPVVATRVDAAIDFGAPEDRPAVSAVHQAAQPTASELHPRLADGDVCVTWEGEVESAGAGDYDFVVFGNNGVRLWLDGRLVVDSWRQGWLPWTDLARVRLAEKRRYPIRLEWRRDQDQGTLRLKWREPPVSEQSVSLWSEVGDGVDYYFVYGPELDAVVAGYRELTGRAPLMPRWAFGLWQSRERYETAEQGLEVLAQFRERRIPVDVLVQDWRYWPDDQWGSHRFDRERFPDPAGWIRAVHERHARLMISVWPKLYRGTEHFAELAEKGFLYPETLRRPTTDWLGHVHTFYDAFHPEARRLFWEQMSRELYAKGVDAWWMDATEPELVGEGTPEALKATMHPTALGSGARMANAYALVSSQAVWEGQRGVDPGRRVFILTRSAFAGSQRYAAATWSGDVSASWTAFANQIPAGLNFTLSGIPYWTTDVGGFAVPPRFAREDARPEDVEEWRELVTRWFQFATFCPLLRVHGQYPFRETWHFGGEDHPAYRSQLAFDHLRYRLLPYVYSLAARVTREHYTMTRALVMDFRHDPEVFGVGDQLMFGPALLVNPVTVHGARSRPVYLPRGTLWYDFWTGEAVDGGRTIEAPAPYESLPVYVKAGSIVPFGPELQYTDEKPADPITLWVWQGADADFELYEDDGVSFAYEKGAFAVIPIHWDESAQRLTLGERKGSFPGMLEERSIKVVWVAAGAPRGYTPEPEAARTIRYLGARTTLRKETPQ
jgi:alpha-D-xyloside xylohydrolase